MTELEHRLQNFIDQQGCKCKTMDEHLQTLKLINENVKIDLNNLSTLFKLISDKNRLRILYLARHQSTCACELEHLLDISQSTIAHHLKKLREAKLIKVERIGNFTDIRLLKPELLDLLDQIS